ncbi:MAG: hypothetical protein WEA77_05615, partial [Hyphomonas sp.]
MAGRSDADISERMAPCAPIRLLRSRAHQKLAERWGLVFMSDPAINGIDPDAFWSHYVFPGEVEVNCRPLKPRQSFDIWDRTVPYCSFTHVTDSAAREYLLIRGKSCIAQVGCTGMSHLSIEPGRMKIKTPDLFGIQRKQKVQEEVRRLLGNGPDIHAARWTKTTQILRKSVIALDCIKAGISQREIASLLYGP